MMGKEDLLEKKISSKDLKKLRSEPYEYLGKSSLSKRSLTLR